MYYLLRIFNYLKTNSWSNLGLLIISIYLIGSSLLLIEPETFTNIIDYTWWFIVTTSTVGYGDLFPSTTWGRLIGVIIIIGGVGSLAMIIGKLSEYIMDINKIRIKGLKQYKMNNHIVLMGYHHEETRHIIEEIIKDLGRCDIVLCADNILENPFIGNECVSFVKGNLISDDVMKRASIKDASKVLIHAPNDGESISVLLAVLNVNTNPDTNIVLTMEDPIYNKHVEQLIDKMGRCVETITDLKTPMMVQSLLDSGSSDMVNQMLSNEGSAIRSHVYNGVDIEFQALGMTYMTHEKILVGVNKQFHPKKDLLVKDGDTLFYFGENRLD